MWTQSTAWRLEIEGQRWMRRWGNRGANVSLRSDGRYRVRVFQLDEHRQTVGEAKRSEAAGTTAKPKPSSSPTLS